MITVISGTNRRGAKTLATAKIVVAKLESMGVEAQLCDLNQLPEELFVPQHYWNVPESFAPFQKMILDNQGIITLTPEYNGSFPGVLKYFIDLLKFPESLRHKPSAFIGLSAGQFGALRSVEQLEMIFQYREAHIFGRRVFLPGIENLLSEDCTQINDQKLNTRLEKMLQEFSIFSSSISEKLPLK